MKKKDFSKLMLTGLVLCLIFTNCTDVPISYSTKVLDSRLIGYWQQTDSTAMYIAKNASGEATITELDFNTKTRNWKKGKSKILYFAKISDGKSGESFLSYKKYANSYVTAKFSFNTNNELVTYPLSQTFLAKYNEEDENNVVLFKTVANFQNFVKSNKRYSDLYNTKEKNYRKSSIKNLDTPPVPVVSAKPKAKNLGIWVSPYDEQYIAFYDDGTLDRYLYYDNEAQWVGQNYRMDEANKVIRVTHSSTGSLMANIYFTHAGTMVWEYRDRNSSDIVFRKIGMLEPEVPKDAIFTYTGTWTTRDGRLILSLFPWSKSTLYYPYQRNLYTTTHDIRTGNITFTFKGGRKEEFTCETFNDNHMAIKNSLTGERFDLYKERDTEKFNRGADAALKLLGFLFNATQGSSGSNSSSYDPYGGSSWLKNEHERQTLDRARGYDNY